ncbi:TonB-dependent receptor [Pedobacter sp. BS3]|nr:TonB-dependent receptor [Pedobacter sp. BS3]
MRTTGTIGLVTAQQLNNQPPTSLVHAFNTVPGVSMEERSPGSYRLSIRGSLLRSPFGIRNVKIYVDDFPLTDAGGNSYLNLFDPSSVNRAEILKGPQAGLFGANSEGVVLVHTLPAGEDSSRIKAGINAGSYGLFQQYAGYNQPGKRYQFSINEAFQRADGYRQNSALNRKSISTSQQYRYAPSGTLRLLALYTDLAYQTPGGLTQEQYLSSPRMARPATSSLPGAAEQQAGIVNRSFFGGITNENILSTHTRFLVSLYGMNTAFSNPFITNYEQRKENTIGIRSFFELKNQWNHVHWQWNTGVEGSITSSHINNYDNDAGRKAAPQKFDKIRTSQDFVFTHLNIDISRKLMIELATSLNFFGYKYRGLYPQDIPWQKKSFDAEWMPRFAASYQATSNFAVRASVSRGYSSPTTDEVRGTNNIINTALQAETGWNYEAGIRFSDNKDFVRLDITTFYYRLNQAIVRRVNADEEDYYINAGGTDQSGIESQLIAWIKHPAKKGFIRSLQLCNDYTFSHFMFRDYIAGTANYSGNKLTGVPQNRIINSIETHFPLSIYLFVQHNYTSSLPLNDANTATASAYHLVQLKAGWRSAIHRKTSYEIYGGIDNLLNMQYSLGNDLNAVGNRYYNAAPLRNVYFGVRAAFL